MKTCTKSDIDVTLHFRSEDRDISIKDVGSIFAFSLKYELFDIKDKAAESFSVSFTDIKAQKPISKESLLKNLPSPLFAKEGYISFFEFT